MIKGRLRRLQDYLQEQKLSAIVINKLENIRYFSGFTGDDSILLVDRESSCLVTDFRYVEQAEQECPQCQIVKQEKGLLRKVAELINSNSFAAVGFEGDSLSFAWHQQIQKLLSDTLFDTSLNVDFLRQIKDQEELANIRKAMDIGDKAFADILQFIRPGVSENQVAARLENTMRELGSSEPSFTTIVASGLRGSLPHGTASEKLINQGEFVTMDYGAVYNGYHSDMTRTICVGQASPKQRHIYDTVLQAQLLGVSLVAPGVAGKAVDEAVRKQLYEAGYAQYFGHGLGHSLGLEIHEEPRLSPSSTCRHLHSRMLITVEPGIYIPNWGGVRIEDTVLVTETGCECLTHSPKELIELGID